MAEALAAVGVASSIIALVEFSLTLYGHIKEIIADVNDVPNSFRPINTQLPVLMRTLEDIGKAFKDGRLDEETAKVLAPTVERFKTSIQELEKLLSGVLLDPKHSKSKNLWKAFKGIAKQSEVKDIVEDIRGYVGTLTFYLVASASSLQPLTDEILVDIRAWLLAPDPTINYQKALIERQANTGQWFLESSLYQAWRGTGSSVWLHGIPGCGKTILSTTIVENIQQYTANDPGKALAYFYFDFKDQQKQGPDSMVRSLMYQLSQQFISVPEELERLYDSCKKGKIQPFSNTLLATLQPVIRVFPHTFMIIDALDECTQREDLIKVIEDISRWQIEGLHLLMTSRREGDIDSTLSQILERRSILSIQTEAVTQDIQLYIRERLSNDDRLRKWRTDTALLNKIEASLLSNARGMFRWAVCQLDFLRECRNRRQLLQALETLPPTLDATYDRILITIRESDQPYALRILRWLTFATRPLYLLEIAEIAAMDPDRVSTFDREEILEDPSDVLSICSSLVVVTDQTQYQHDDTSEQNPQFMPIVQLAHYSVKEYLVSPRILTGPAAPYGLDTTLCHTQLARCCLQYLLQFEIFDEPHKRSLQEFVLKSYSAKSWAIHAQDGLQGDKDINSLGFELLSTCKTAFAIWQGLYECDKTYVVSIHDINDSGFRPRLYFASLFGLSEAVQRMLENGEDPNAQSDSLGTPPLQAAARNGHISTARALIRKGADVHLIGRIGSNALSEALSQGHIHMASFLLDHGAYINAYCQYYSFAIHAAIEGGINAVQLLLERDCDLHVTGWRQNALQYCAGNGQPEIAKILIEHGAQINGLQGNSETALQTASGAGNSAMVKLLLAHGADVHEQSRQGNTAIHEAAENGHIEIIEFLIEHGTASNTNSPHFNFDGILRSVSCDRKNDIAALMLKHGADPNAISLEFLTPLEAACRSDEWDYVRFLLAHGADPNAVSAYMEDSPFLRAIRRGDLDLVKCFIDNGADPDGQDRLKGAPLVLASQGHTDIVQLLVERGADTWCHKKLGSAVEKLCGDGQLKTVKLLVSKGAPIYQRNCKEIHPLQSASKYGHLDVARYLLDGGADITAKISGLHEAVSMGNKEMALLLLQYLAAHGGGDAYFGEALSRAVNAEPLDPRSIRSEKGRPYTDSKCLADVYCAVWTWTKPIDMVQLLIDEGANVNARDDRDSTALSQAVWKAISQKDHSVVDLLIERGADVNARDNQWGTVLEVTFIRHDFDIASLLIEKGANVNVRSSKSANWIFNWWPEQGVDDDERRNGYGTILEVASLGGDLRVVKFLIEKGAHVEDCCGAFGSALIAASCSLKDHPEITNVLLRTGANFDKQHPLHGTALSAASKNGHTQVVKLLLERGASINNVTTAHGSALRAALQGSFDRARQASNEHPSLVASSVESQTMSVVELLVQRGADLGPDSNVLDFVLQAAMNNDLHVLKLLIEKGSNNSHVLDNDVFNVMLCIASCRGQHDIVRLLFSIEWRANSGGYGCGQLEQYSLALKSALSQRHFEIAKTLVDRGANARLSQLQWKTHLQIAAAEGHLEILKFLTKKDTNLKRNAESCTDALVAASASGHYAIVDFLLQKGADINTTNKGCMTALSVASKRGQYKIIELLISKGADVNATSEAFLTALQAASMENHLDIVRLLISNGADVNVTNERFGSALCVAVSKRNDELMNLLLRRGAGIDVQGGKYGNALQTALAKCHYHEAKRLIENGAVIHARGGRYGDALQALLSIRIPQGHDARERHAMANYLIQHGADINAQGGQYGSALLAALSNSHYHIAEMLIQKGVNIDIRAGVINKARLTKLLDIEYSEAYPYFRKFLTQKIAHLVIRNNVATAALMGGFPDTARELLLHQETSFISSTIEYREILSLAVIHGNVALVKALLDRAEDRALSNNAVTDLFHLAIAWRRNVLVMTLIDRGADINARDKDGHSALQLAVLSFNAFMVKALVEKGAHINASSPQHGTVLQTAILVPSWGVHYRPHYITFIFSMELVDYLLGHGADLNIQSGRYGNALQAAIRTRLMQDEDIDEYLSYIQGEDSEDEDESAYEDRYHRRDREYYEHKIEYFRYDLVQTLIDKGANVNAEGGEYGSALQAALCLGKSDIAELLIDEGADVHLLGGVHGNMVQAALCGDCCDLAELLLRQGVDVNINEGFDKALQTALSKGFDSIVDILLEEHNGADLTDQELEEASQKAVLEGDIHRGKALIRLIVRRSEPSGRQRKLNSAVTAALARGHHEIFEYLVEQGARIDLETFRRCADVCSIGCL